MNLAKISANGQITVPVEIRRQLGLKSGDKMLFFQNQNGEICEMETGIAVDILSFKLHLTIRNSVNLDTQHSQSSI